MPERQELQVSGGESGDGVVAISVNSSGVIQGQQGSQFDVGRQIQVGLARCLVCGSFWNMHDTRRRYCSLQCFKKARNEYWRERRRRQSDANPEFQRKRNATYRQSERGRAAIKEYSMRPEVKARRLLLWHAREEAKDTGVDVRTILIRWGADPGRVGTLRRRK